MDIDLLFSHLIFSIFLCINYYYFIQTRSFIMICFLMVSAIACTNHNKSNYVNKTNRKYMLFSSEQVKTRRKNENNTEKWKILKYQQDYNKIVRRNHSFYYSNQVTNHKLQIHFTCPKPEFKCLSAFLNIIKTPSSLLFILETLTSFQKN